MERLEELYVKTIRPQLGKDLAITNVMAVPKVTKVTVNVGLNLARTDSKKIDEISQVVSTITGQKATIRRARKSIASFKIRAGEPVGLSLTLRGKRMYDFLERLIRIALPRVRDFRGISRSHLDGHGNLSLGLKDVAIFPEVRYQDAERVSGLEVTIVTTAKTNQAGEALLKAYGIPFV